MKRSGLFFIIVGNLLLVVIIFLVLNSSFFIVKSVDVQAEKLGCADNEQIKASSNILGINLLFLNSKKIKTDIKNKFLCIREVNISKQFPNKVKIIVLGREAFAKLADLKNNEATISSSLQDLATPSAEESSEIYLVDKDGIIFSKKGSELNIPAIFIDNQKSPYLSSSLKVLEKLNIFGVHPKETQLLENFFIIFSTPKIIFKLDSERSSSTNKVDTQIASLQLILEKAKIDNSSLEFIDLRFDKPVVKIAPKKN